MPKKKNKNTVKKYGDQSKARPLSKKAKGRTAVGSHSNANSTQAETKALPVENPVTTSLNRTEFASRAVSTPLDHDGIPFMNSTQIAPYFGVFKQDAAGRMADYPGIPSYKVIFKPNEKGQHSGKIYFSIGEVVNFLKSIAINDSNLNEGYESLNKLYLKYKFDINAKYPNGDFPSLHRQLNPEDWNSGANTGIGMFLFHLPNGRKGPMIAPNLMHDSETRKKNLEEFNSSPGRKPYLH